MTALHLELQIPEQHPCYAGHFPGNPIVPGALLLQWIQNLVLEQCPRQQVTAVPAVKFLSMVKPGSCLAIDIDLKDTGKLRFRVFSETNTICEGSFIIEDILQSQ
jgi:3-hydroxyacyl-[acyl-carrier-protein] dehydratase